MGQTKPNFPYLLATSQLMHDKSCLTAQIRLRLHR